jgi:hypothetical protein
MARSARTSLATLLGCFAIGALAPAATAAVCPNEALRVAQGATTLPGCMALEMVSPPQKFSQPAFLPSFSRDGQRMLLTIQTALADTPGYQYYGGDSYVASRVPLAWQIAPTSPLDPTIVAGGLKWGSPSTYTPGLERWAQLGATQVQVQLGVVRLFGGGLDGSFAPLSPLLEPIDDSGSSQIQQAVISLVVDGSSSDLSATVFRPLISSTAYLPGDPRSDSPSTEPGGDRKSYIAVADSGGEAALELLARDKDGTVYGGRCGTHLGGGDGTFNQGAISSDGSRIFFSTRPAQLWDPEEGKEPRCEPDNNGLRILERTTTAQGAVITEVVPGGPADGDDLFQAASADGTAVYFTSPRKLAASDVDTNTDPCNANLGASKGCDLYLYDATKPEGSRVIQASTGGGPTPADVVSSVTAISGDGSRAYFVAQGVLTGDQNPEGANAQSGQANLYLYEAETGGLSFLATLAPADQGGMWGSPGSFFGDAYAVPLYGPGLEGGGDGHILAFASKASLTVDDLDGGFRDVFRYDAEADTLERVSKAGEGGDDNGPFDVTVNPAVAEINEYNFGEATRWVSEDGRVIAFATLEPLLPGDEDEVTNPYVWDAGQLGATFAPLTEPPTAAPVGDQVAFSTREELLPTDRDRAKDVYVAREGGGFPLPVPPTVCDPRQEGACRTAPSFAPGSSVPATASFSGPGNQAQPTRCGKGRVKRRGKCVRKRGRGKAKKQTASRKGRSR